MDLIDYLSDKKFLKKKEAQNIKSEERETGRKPEELILDKGLLDEKTLFQTKSKFLKIPLKEKISKKAGSKAISIVPRESVEFYKMIPLRLDEDKGILEVGMVYPKDVQGQEALKFLTRQHKLKPKVFLISLSAFRNYLSKYHSPRKEMEKALGKLEKEALEEKKTEKGGVQFEGGQKRLSEEAPIIKMVAVILRQGVEGGASDIHIEPTKDNLRIRYRMDGILYPSLILPLKIHQAIVARIKILSKLKIDETRIPQDGRFSTIIHGKKIDFRVATFPTNLGEKVALRILDPEKGLKSLDELGLTGRNLEVVKESIKNPYGMVLSTGPTGSGKTTTLYAILRILNKGKVNIVTLEDPVEYFIEGINQSQVKPDIGYSFATGLRQILRQDPDIIMVGEVRDEETASLAVHAGLTGHLVLSTLHTISATGVIPRLIDMGVENFLIPSTLNVALSQRLVRVLCKNCKKKVKASQKETKYILDKIGKMPGNQRPKIEEPIYIYKPKGCSKCKNKGYKGRIGVFEVLEMTREMARIVSSDPTENKLFDEARNQGMITMEEDGLLKVLKGVTSLEEIMRVVEE